MEAQRRRYRCRPGAYPLGLWHRLSFGFSFNTIRRHHIAHRNPAIMMERNFNLTYPIADWLFGTSDLDCGLLGHVFNGYSRAHVRTNLKSVRNGADDPLAGHVRLGTAR